jgi:hypothetical protein
MPRSSTSFKAGQSGNPNGRPSQRRQELSELLDSVFTQADRIAVVKGIVSDAKKGDKDARIILLAYTFGKPVERKEISGPDGEPLKAYVSVSPSDWSEAETTAD